MMEITRCEKCGKIKRAMWYFPNTAAAALPNYINVATAQWPPTIPAYVAPATSSATLNSFDVCWCGLEVTLR